MTWLCDSTELVGSGGWLSSEYPGHGIRGDMVPSSGTHGPSPIFDDLDLPGDSSKEYRITDVEALTSGWQVTPFEDTSVIIVPPAGMINGTGQFRYRIWENGVDLGTVTQPLTVGTVEVFVSNLVSSTSLSTVAGTQIHSASVSPAVNSKSVLSVTGYQSYTGAVSSMVATPTMSAPMADGVIHGSVSPLSSSNTVQQATGSQSHVGLVSSVVTSTSLSDVVANQIYLASVASLMLARSLSSVTGYFIPDGAPDFRQGNVLNTLISALRRATLIQYRYVNMTKPLEKRSAETVLFDIDCSSLIGGSTTLVSLGTPVCQPSGLTFAPGVINPVEINYDDGRVAAPGKVIQVLIGGGSIPTHADHRDYTVSFPAGTSVSGESVRAVFTVRVKDTP